MKIKKYQILKSCLSVIFILFVFIANSTLVNDDPCGALELPVNNACVKSSQTTIGATNSTTPSTSLNTCSPYTTTIYNDVWFKVVVPNNGVLAFDVTPGTYPGLINHGVMAIYSGSCGALNLIKCHYDLLATSPIIVQDGLTPGDTIRVRLGNTSTGAAGTFQFCVTSPNDLPNTTGNPPASDNCSSAGAVCSISGYKGTTVGYSPTSNSDWPDLLTALGTSVSLDNDSYIKIVPAKTTVSFTIWLTSSVRGTGIQIILFSTNQCFGPVSYDPLNYWDMNGRAATQSQVVTFNNLTIGQTYYLIFDGYQGDECNFQIDVGSDGGGLAVTTAISPLTSEICLGDHVDLTCIGGKDGYDWTKSADAADLNVTVGAANVTATPTTVGLHHYTVSSNQINQNCPNLNGTATINVKPAITVGPIVGSTSVCKNGTIVLKNDTPGGTWSINNANASIVVNPLTNECTLTGLVGGTTCDVTYKICSPSTQTISILNTEQTNPIIEDVTGPNHVYCYFNLNKDTLTMNGNTGATTGLWSYIAPAGGEANFFSTTDFNTGIKISKYGEYKFIFNELVCKTSDTLLVNFRPGAYTFIDSVFTVCTGSSHEFKPTFPYPEYVQSTVWSTGDVTPSITVKDQGVYSLTVSTGCGNPFVSTSKLFIKVCEIESMPNVITPNNDGINDTYIIEVEDGIFKTFDIVITNRWGSVISEYSDPKSAWNGKNKAGDFVDEGVYFYSVKGETIEGKKITKQGFIHVIYE